MNRDEQNEEKNSIKNKTRQREKSRRRAICKRTKTHGETSIKPFSGRGSDRNVKS